MLAALFLLAGVLVIGACLGIPIAIFTRRQSYLPTLPALARDGIQRITNGFFDGPPQATNRVPAHVRLEGTSGGEPVELEVSFPEQTNAAYVRTGERHLIVAEHTLRLGLRGAQPKLSVAPKRLVRVRPFDLVSREPEDELSAFDVTVEDDTARAVFDDELRRELLLLANQCGNLRSIRVGPRGLEITWLGSGGAAPHTRPAQAEELEGLDRARLAGVRAFAGRLQAKILRTLEADARGRMRVDGIDGYRERAEPVELLEGAEPDDARVLASRR